MGHKDALPRSEMIDYVMSCWDESAGSFGAHPGHDAHIHATLSGLQVLIMQDALDRVDVERVVVCECHLCAGLQHTLASWLWL